MVGNLCGWCLRNSWMFLSTIFLVENFKKHLTETKNTLNYLLFTSKKG